MNKFTTDPYSARALILKLEMEFNINIRVHESHNYCMICIDKEVKKRDIYGEIIQEPADLSRDI